MAMSVVDDGRRLLQARDRFAESEGEGAGGALRTVRPVVADSWRRSSAAGAAVDGSRLPPVRMAGEELAAYRRGHPLAGLLPLFRDLLGPAAAQDGHLLAICDADGTLLWVEGSTAILERAEQMRFVEGAVWTEAQAGTNAPGTAIAVGRPVRILGAEHYNAAVQPWSCAAAPVHDPRDGRLLGVIDVTGTGDVGTPAALAAVRAAAYAAEAELARRMEAADGVALRACLDRLAGPRAGSAGLPMAPEAPEVPTAPAAVFSPDGRMLYSVPGCAVADLADGRPVAVERLGPEGHVLVRSQSRGELRSRPAGAIALTALGRDGAVLRTDRGVHHLSPRHSEIVVALALAGHGMTGDRLAVDLSEQELHSSTVRAEMTRLRAILGPEILGSRPYCLARPAHSDFATVGELLAQGRVAEAMALYTGPLLPASQAPVVVEHRRALHEQVRAAVLALGDSALLRRWADSEWGAGDGQVWRALADRLPGGSPQRAAAAAQARMLNAEAQVRPIAAVLQRSRS